MSAMKVASFVTESEMVLGSCDRDWISNLRNCPWDRAFMSRDKRPFKYPIHRESPFTLGSQIGTFLLSYVHPLSRKLLVISEMVACLMSRERWPSSLQWSAQPNASHPKRIAHAIDLFSNTRQIGTFSNVTSTLIPRFAWKRSSQSIKHVALCDMFDMKDSSDKLRPGNSMSRRVGRYSRQIWIAKTRKCTWRLWKNKGVANP